MNLYLRLFINLLRSRWQSGICTTDETAVGFRVWPQDIDVFGHMNNGRYLQIMDIARSTWMSRCGVLGVMRRKRWGAALGGGSVRFRRALKPFQSYRVTTRLLCWDSRWFYLEHGFVDKQDRCIAVGISRAAIRSRNGWVKAAEMMAALEPGATSPPVPDYVHTLMAAELEMEQAFCQRDNDSGIPDQSGTPTPTFASNGSNCPIEHASEQERGKRQHSLFANQLPGQGEAA